MAKTDTRRGGGPARSAGTSAGGSRAGVIRHIRGEFGATQAQLAMAMGTSVKAIQSYEQGWRNVPTRALLQLLVLLAIRRRRQVDAAPCWDILRCTPEMQKGCPSFTFGDGQFCWLVCAGGGKCRCASRRRVRRTRGDLLPCMQCDVVRRLLRSQPATGATDASAG